jgi:molybdopterin synthase sulfur carrier subunit
MPAPITILYFAWLRERIGTSEETLVLPDETRSLADLLALLRSRGEAYAAALADTSRVRAAINQTFAQPTASIGPGDEIAFFPPVTGG